MSTKAAALIIYIGIFVLIFVVGIMIRVYCTKGGWKCEYDERQQISQGRGYKYGYYTMLIYFAVNYMAITILGHPWAEEYVDILLGMLLGIGVFCIYCIMNEAFLSLNQKPKRYAAIILVIAIMNGLGAASSIMRGNVLIQDGKLTGNCLNLYCAILMFAVWFAMVAKYFISKREVD